MPMLTDDLLGPCGRPGARGHHIGDPWFLECFFFNIWFGMVLNQKNLINAHKAEILVKIYWLCRAEKDNHYKLFNFFSTPSNFIAVRFVWLKKVHKCPAYFIFYFLVHFFKEKIKSGFFGGFYCFFFQWAFKKKTRVVFLGRFFTTTLLY